MYYNKKNVNFFNVFRSGGNTLRVHEPRWIVSVSFLLIAVFSWRGPLSKNPANGVFIPSSIYIYINSPIIHHIVCSGEQMRLYIFLPSLLLLLLLLQCSRRKGVYPYSASICMYRCVYKVFPETEKWHVFGSVVFSLYFLNRIFEKSLIVIKMLKSC